MKPKLNFLGAVFPCKLLTFFLVLLQMTGRLINLEGQNFPMACLVVIGFTPLSIDWETLLVTHLVVTIFTPVLIDRLSKVFETQCYLADWHEAMARKKGAQHVTGGMYRNCR